MVRNVGWNVPKQKYKLSNWSEYSDALRRLGEIDVWLSEDAISQWYEKMGFMMRWAHQNVQRFSHEDQQVILLLKQLVNGLLL